MNERERKEFEHHKKMAEEQLNKMYYGASQIQKSKGGLEMPSFLASPKPRQNIKEPASTQNLNQTPKAEPPKKDNPPTKNGLGGGGNLLNLLNFKNMKMDSDRLIILVVCLLLSGEQADELLMLALIYIML